jgi:hypothetical protein
MVGVRRLVSVGFGCVLGAVLGVLVVAAPALAAGDANQASCANEGMPGFRSYMADCRAYELVSPSSIGGELVVAPEVSGSGAVIGESLGGAGGVGNIPGTGAVYAFARGADGWLTGPLNPPASLLSVGDNFGFKSPIAASSDFGRALFGLHSPSEPLDAENLYVSEPGGAFKEVGPDVPPSALTGEPGNSPYASPASAYEGLYLFSGGYLGGASSDLSHIVFTLYGPSSEGPPPKTHDYLWPGDSTILNHGEEGLPSLYEYVGTGNTEPKLVGVSDQHALASDTEAHLISQCGTLPGGPFSGAHFPEESYNDVSANGSVVFFTALHNLGCSGEQPPVNELYARVGGAKTVAVAEPSQGYCAGSPSPPCADAHFAGASEDGSRVFFTTAQSLLPEDEGGAGSGNDLYEAEINGGVRTGLVQVSHDPEGPLAAAEVQGVVRVSEDGSHVYFVAQGVLTSTPDTSLAPGQQVAVAGQENLYVYERDSAFPNGHVAFIGSLAGGDSADWRALDFERPVDVTPDGRFLLFVSQADLTPVDTSSTPQVFRYDAQTGTVVRVSVGQRGFNENGNTRSFAASFPIQQYALFSSPLDSTRAMSDDGQYVFFQSADGLTPLALNGQQISEELGEPVYAKNVYEYHNGEVALVSDGEDRSVVSTGQLPAVALVGTDSSGQDVFFTSADRLVPEDGSIQQVVYDARAGGGFSAVSPVECSGDGCQGALRATPALAVGGSASQSAEGDLTPPPVLVAKPKPKSVSARARQLARALRVCAREHGKQRRRCEARARAHARAASRAAKSNGRNR